jgi:opacity protein-like surface antigen
MRVQPRHGTVKLAAILTTVLGIAVLTPRSAAADSERGQKWQFTFPITFTSGVSVDGEDGTSFDMNDDVGWGLGFGYNLNENFVVGADFTWLSANYDVTIATDNDSDQIPDATASLSGTLDAGTLNFYGQYNILKKSITPFVRAGFGWTWVDSNIPAGSPVGTCWWDPWYGYICGSWQPTYGATNFSYGAAAGVRADIKDKFMVELSYNMLWIDFDKSDTTSFDGVRLNIGWKF